MACVAVDTNFPDSEQAVKLGELLNERLAWCHAIRLWAWGIDQDRENGMVRLESKRICEITSWRGDPDDFIAAMVAVGLLVPQADGCYYMSGWSRNKEYFARKRRMKKYRVKDKTSRDASLVASPDAQRDTSRDTYRDTHSLSLSLSRSLSHERDSAREEEPLTCEQIEKRLVNGEGWKLPKATDMQRIAALCPVPAEKFNNALAKTKSEATKPNFTYFAGCLETECRPQKQRQESKRNPAAGYHPGSTEFGEGDQTL